MRSVNMKPRNRMEALLYLMTVSVIFLTMLAVYFLLTSGESSERIIRELRGDVQSHQTQDLAGSCSSFINHAVLMESVALVAEAHDIEIPPPHMIVTSETRRACDIAGMDLEASINMKYLIDAPTP